MMDEQLKPVVALLGAGGLMGSEMAVRLAGHGFTVHAWNRTADKLAPLAQHGIQLCQAPEQAVQPAEVVIVMLADGPTVQGILQGDAVASALKDRVVLQMSTIGPSESQQLCDSISQLGATYIEAPVLGSQLDVRTGALQVMVGFPHDPRATHPAAWAVMAALGKEVHYMGPIPLAATVKLALNQLIQTLTVGFSGSLGLVQRAGGQVLVDKFMPILRASGFYAPTYDRKLPNMLSRDFSQTNFPTKLMLKDTQLFIEEAQRAGLDTRLQSAVASVLGSTIEQGFGEADYSSLYEAVVHPQQQQQGQSQGTGNS